MCVLHVDEKKFFPFRELQHFPLCFPERTKYTGRENHVNIPYCPLSVPPKPIYWYKPPALGMNEWIIMKIYWWNFISTQNNVCSQCHWCMAYDLSSFSLMTICTDRNTLSWNKDVKKIQVLTYTFQPCFWFPDWPWSSSLRLTQVQYTSEPLFRSHNPSWPTSLRMVHGKFIKVKKETKFLSIMTVWTLWSGIKSE